MSETALAEYDAPPWLIASDPNRGVQRTPHRVSWHTLAALSVASFPNRYPLQDFAEADDTGFESLFAATRCPS